MAGFSKKDEKFRQYALTASPLRVLLSVCMPLALYQALQSIFKILDALMASHIGADAVSAVACLSQITLMITALGGGLAVGGSIKISEAYGRGDEEAVRRRVATVYAMAIGVSVIVAATLVPFAPQFLRLLKTPEDLITAGVGYFRVEVLTLVVSFFNTVYIAIERSRGHARKILVLNLGIIIIKLSLSALFVYVLHGGLILIAVATLAGQVLMLLYAAVTMPRDEGAFRFSPRNIRFKKDTVAPIMKLAYPVSVEKVLFAADELTGLIGAAARMRPSKSVMDMELSSLKKKFKDKKFAAGCSRDVIKEGADRLGWELDTLLERTILAMRECEDAVNAQL